MPCCVADNLTATAPFGAIVLGINNPALDLTPLGMPGCTQYSDALAPLLYLPLGATASNGIQHLVGDY